MPWEAKDDEGDEKITTLMITELRDDYARKNLVHTGVVDQVTRL
jgi:hypothetical protein